MNTITRQSPSFASRRRPRPRVFAPANQKGASARPPPPNLNCFAAIGERVLIGSRSTGQRFDRARITGARERVELRDAGRRESLRDVVIPTPAAALHRTLDGGSSGRRTRNRRPSDRPGSHGILRATAPRARTIRNGSPMCWWIVRPVEPSTINALAAADAVAVPLHADSSPLGPCRTFDHGRAGAQHARPASDRAVLTMYDFRNSLPDVSRTCALMGDRSARRSFPAMSACPRRRRMASRRCFTTSNAPAAKRI